jgi:uncharacterized membrane protein
MVDEQARNTEPDAGGTRDLAVLADKAIFRLAKHWLALANTFWGLYVTLPILAPLLMIAGLALPARIIYVIYRPACHQRPERSYFLGGPDLVYSPQELAAAGVDLGPLARDIGNESIGWKMAFCERDVAIYGTIFLGGVAYALLRQYRRRPGAGTWRMPLRWFLLFLVPMGVDGVLQLFGFYESNWLLRTITGVIFGLGAVLFAYPYAQEGFDDVCRTINDKLHLE